MRRSEIFENFVKIAEDKGLVSKADHAEHTEKNLDNPRWDSLSIEQIGKLYNLKLDRPKDMEYEHNIMEDAHPDTVVISPSYDKLNGLVENEIEGQNIRARIVMKDPDGHLVNRKYAEKQLVLSLVRVGNDLDNRDEDELRKLADICLLQATNSSMVKTALYPLLFGAAASIIGAVYLKNHIKFHSDGFEMDFQKVMEEIEDLLTSNSNLGVGYTYRPEFIATVNDLKDKLQKFYENYKQLEPVLDKIDAPKDAKSLVELAQHPASTEVIDAIKNFKGQAGNIYAFLRKCIQDFSSESYKARQVVDKGIFTQLMDAAKLHGGSGLIADDIDDVQHALQTVWGDIVNIMKSIQGANSVEQAAQQQLEQTAAEFEQAVPSEPSAEKPEEKDSSVWTGLNNMLGKGLG